MIDWITFTDAWRLFDAETGTQLEHQWAKGAKMLRIDTGVRTGGYPSASCGMSCSFSLGCHRFLASPIL
jgi:hypothetical protein